MARTFEPGFFIELDRGRDGPYALSPPGRMLDTDQARFTRRLEADLAELSRIREGLPRTLCENCGHCCQRSESIVAYSVEFHRIARYLGSEMPGDRLASLKKRVEIMNFSRHEFYAQFHRKSGFLQLPCPCLLPDGQGCIIYPVRPNTCRLYGLMGKGIDPRDPCVRRCSPACDKLRIHPEDEESGWNCCDAYRLPIRLNRISQYFIYHSQDMTIGNSFDLLSWLVLYFDVADHPL